MMKRVMFVLVILFSVGLVSAIPNIFGHQMGEINWTMSSCTAGQVMVGISNSGTASCSSFSVSSLSAPDGSPSLALSVDNDGNVGIGTTTPGAKLEVNGANSDVLMIIRSGVDGVDARLVLQETANYGMNFEYDGTANTGYIGMANNVAPNGAWSKRIQMSRAGTEVAFMAGNVGIGTTSPGAKLHVVSSVAEMLKLESVAGAGINFIDTDTNQEDWTIIVGANDMAFRRASDSSDRLRLYGDGKIVLVPTTGNVGIGTTTPSAKLEVVGGSVKTTGGLIIETRNNDPLSPVDGQLWLRLDINP